MLTARGDRREGSGGAAGSEPPQRPACPVILSAAMPVIDQDASSRREPAGMKCVNSAAVAPTSHTAAPSCEPHDIACREGIRGRAEVDQTVRKMLERPAP